LPKKINSECIACGSCEPECPVNAIEEGEPIYKIDTDVCTDCNGYHDSAWSMDVCPTNAIVDASSSRSRQRRKPRRWLKPKKEL